MAAKQTVKVKGVSFSLYEKSIRVEGVTCTYFFNREVTRSDAKELAALIELGKRRKAEEIEKAFDHMCKIVRMI